MKEMLRKKPAKTVSAVRRRSAALVPAGRFDEVLALIEAARRRAYQAVNTELVSLYWELGEYISNKIANAEWGDSVVDELAATIARRYPGMRGYTRRNLFRMRQFFEAYRGAKKVSALLTQLPWTHHLLIRPRMTRSSSTRSPARPRPRLSPSTRRGFRPRLCSVASSTSSTSCSRRRSRKGKFVTGPLVYSCSRLLHDLAAGIPRLATRPSAESRSDDTATAQTARDGDCRSAAATIGAVHRSRNRPTACWTIGRDLGTGRMTTPLSPVIVSCLETAAVDRGFDEECARDRNWLHFSIAQGSDVLDSRSTPRLSRALAEPPDIRHTPCGESWDGKPRARKTPPQRKRSGP